MLLFSLECSAAAASASLYREGKLLGEEFLNVPQTHSVTLLPMAKSLLEHTGISPTQIDYYAVSRGPGSFTGLRIGSATAKGLGLALKKPLVEVPTLEGLAWNLWGASEIVCPVMDARRNQVYTGAYTFTPSGEDFTLETVLPQSPMDVGDLVEKLNGLGREVILLGDGVPVYREQIRKGMQVPFRFAPAGNNRQRAASIAGLGLVYFKQNKNTVEAALHQPEYLRKSQAEAEEEKK